MWKGTSWKSLAWPLLLVILIISWSIPYHMVVFPLMKWTDDFVPLSWHPASCTNNWETKLTQAPVLSMISQTRRPLGIKNSMAATKVRYSLLAPRRLTTTGNPHSWSLTSSIIVLSFVEAPLLAWRFFSWLGHWCVMWPSFLQLKQWPAFFNSSVSFSESLGALRELLWFELEAFCLLVLDC